MTENPRVSYTASVETADELEPWDPEDWDFEECTVCGEGPPIALPDVGEVIRGHLAVGRWWALCRTCAALADASDGEGLALRATAEIRDEGWMGMVVDALLAGGTVQIRE